MHSYDTETVLTSDLVISPAALRLAKRWGVKISVCILFALVGRVAFGPAAFADDHVSQKLNSAVGALEKLSFSVLGSTKATNQLAEFGAVDHTVGCKIVRCDGLTRYRIQPGAEGTAPFYVNEYLVYDDGRILSVQAAFNSSGEQVADGKDASLMVMLTDPALVKDESQIRGIDKVVQSLSGAEYAFFQIGGSSLRRYLDTAGDELVPGPAPNHLRATSRLGVCEVVVSPEHGWLPKSLRVSKSRESDYGGRSVEQFYKLLPPVGGIVLPAGVIPDVPVKVATEVDWTVSVDEFGEFEGVWYPRKVRVEMVTRFASGETNRSDISLGISALPRGTEESCGGSIEIPDGYKVSVDGAAQLPYKWKDGRVVAGVPDLPLDPAYSIPLPTPHSKRWWLVILNVGVVSVIVILLVVRRAWGRRND